MFLVEARKAQEMHKLRKAEDEDAQHGHVRPNEDCVGEQGQKQREDELCVVAVFLVCVNDAKENASIFQQCGAPVTWEEDVERQKADVNEYPDY